MKKIIFAIFTVVVVAAGAMIIVAQKRVQGHEKGFGKGSEHIAGMMFRGLDLSVDQKAKVKAIVDASHANVEPLMTSIKTNREKMRAATANGIFDQTEVSNIAHEQAALLAILMVEKEKAKSQIFAILTDEQKAKANQARENFEKRMTEGGRKAQRSEF